MAADDSPQSKASDLVKRILSVGVGALFLTEESLRGLVSELKIPKELLGSVLESAGKTRKEFMGKLSSDLIEKVMSRVDPKSLIEEILAKNEIEFQVKVSLKPKAGSKASEDES